MGLKSTRCVGAGIVVKDGLHARCWVIVAVVAVTYTLRWRVLGTTSHMFVVFPDLRTSGRR